MNIVLWILQILFGLYFILVGIMHFVVPPGLPAMMSWMYDLSPTLHWISGTAEILGGLGLILPGLFKIQTRLTPLAAWGLTLVMILAAGYHLLQGQYLNIINNLIIAAICAFIAIGRTRMVPLQDKAA